MPSGPASASSSATPANTSFSSEPASRRSYTGELYSYYYALSSTLGGPTEVKLQDYEDTYVLGEDHRGPDTNQWATSMVRAISYYTYRNRLPAPLANGSDHDAGWGCMIRTGQMMMSEALRRAYKVKLPPQPLKKIKDSEMASLTLDPQNSSGSSANNLSRPRAANSISGASDGFRSPSGTSLPEIGMPTTPPRQLSTDSAASYPPIFGLTSQQSEVFHFVSSLFYDTPTAPFGIHNMTHYGAEAAKVKVGEWFTPTALVRTLCAIMKSKEVQATDIPSRLAIVAALDGVVALDEIDARFAEGKAVLLLVPVMLGLNGLSPGHQKAILKLLEVPLTLGIVGGKPRQSLYFVGHQNETCFYLDPHIVQPAFTSPATIGNRCGPRGNVPVSALDPNMVLCFYFDSEIEHNMFQEFFFTDLRVCTEYPLFSYSQSKPKACEESEVDDDMDFSDDEDLAATAAPPIPTPPSSTPPRSSTPSTSAPRTPTSRSAQ